MAKFKMKLLYFSVLLIASILITQCNVGNNDLKIKEVTAREAAKKIRNDEVKVIDVRTKREYQNGYIPGAININYNSEDFKTPLKQLPKDENYLLYCASGRRSVMAAKQMKSLGIDSVSHLKNGIRAWENASLPITRDPN